MADYNVNMKQWNGSSFDNVLPLAFNSNALEGKSYDDIIQYAKSRDLMLYTGQYTGTGKYGSSNPVTLTFPFEPVLLIMPIEMNTEHFQYPTLNLSAIDTSPKTFVRVLGSSATTVTFYIFKSSDGKTINMYSTDTALFNTLGYTYYYAAIGGYDMGGQIPVGNTYTITSSQSWKVPATGRWMLELYGRGGYGTFLASGGASCQHYDSINLEKGAFVDIVIGNGNNSSTKFGNYTVNNAGDAESATPGTGTGNRGKNGVVGGASVYGTGAISSSYGYGSGNGASGGPGAVYLKYLGE